MEAYIWACELEVVKINVFRGFRPTPPPIGGWVGVRSEYCDLSLDYSPSNTGVQFAIEKYFRAVFL